MPYVRTQPIIRPVFMIVEEVQTPARTPIDITRCDKWTLVSVQPKAATPGVIQEIATRLGRHPSEIRQWYEAFVGEVEDIRPRIAAPLRYLTPEQRSIPCLPHYIPAPLRAPWASYT